MSSVETLLVQSLVGAAIGWQLPNLWRCGRYVVVARWRPHVMAGDWHTYHYSRSSGQIQFRHQHLKIRRAVLGGIKVETIGQEKLLKYKGDVVFEHGHLLLLVIGSNHNERWQARFPEPVPGVTQRLLGLLLGFDFDGKPYSAHMLATTEDMTEADAKDFIETKMPPIGQDHSLRLP